MSFWSGLVSETENAVSSVKSEAQSLVESFTPSTSPAPASKTTAAAMRSGVTPFVGPLLPNQPRPGPMPIPAAPVAAPSNAPKSDFNIVSDMLSGSFKKAEGFFGFTPTPAPTASTAAPDYTQELSVWSADLSRWKLILSSLDKSMNQRDGARDLSSKFASWVSGPYQAAEDALHALATGSGSHDTAQSAHDDALAKAQALQSEIQDRWSSFAAQGVPTVSDYVKAPVTALTETGMRAVKVVEKVAAPAVSSTETILKYGPYALAGLAALYVLSILPKGRGL